MGELFVVPPAVDYRLIWARWHYPLGVLAWAAHAAEPPIYVFDYLAEPVCRLPLGAQPQGARLFRFGNEPEALRLYWDSVYDRPPERVWVTTQVDYWWPGAAEVVRNVLTWWPGVSVVVGGRWPQQAPDHCAQILGSIASDCGDQEDSVSWSCECPTSGAALHPAGYRARSICVDACRTSDEVIEEVRGLPRLRGSKLYFVRTDGGSVSARSDFACILEGIPPGGPRPLGLVGIRGADVTPNLARVLHQVDCRPLYVECDTPEEAAWAAYNLASVGYGGRSPDIGAYLLTGYPGENLDATVRSALRLNQSYSTVVPVCYAPSRDDLRGAPPDPATHSPFAFPMAPSNGLDKRDYAEFLLLVAMLNRKVRGNSLAFAGDAKVLQLFREALRDVNADSSS